MSDRPSFPFDAPSDQRRQVPAPQARRAERYRLVLRGDASNAFNHANPSTFASLSILSTLFGQIGGCRDPRIIQIGAKLYF